MTLTKGIDVSVHQGSINWSKVKASGIDFVIIRAGYGKVMTQKDKQFETNYTNAKAQGLPVGAYWYSYAKTVSEAYEEAEACLACIKGKTFEYPIYFDIEDNSQLKLSKQLISEIIKAFCSTLERAGYFVGVYSYLYFINNLVDSDVKSKYSIWIAQTDTDKCDYKGDYGIWQYSFKGHVDGISGDVDMDLGYLDFPNIIKKAGLNGFIKDTEVQVKDQISVIISIDGKQYKGNLT